MTKTKNATLIKSGFIAFFTAFFCLAGIACTKSDSSIGLSIPPDSVQLPLKALNKNAQSGTISNPEKDGQLLYGFEKSPEFYVFTHSGRYALELEFEPLRDSSTHSGDTRHPEPKTDTLKTSTLKTNMLESGTGTLKSGTLKSSTLESGTEKTGAVKRTGTAPGATRALGTQSAVFTAGLLYEENFTPSGKPKKDTVPNYPLQARILPQQRFTVSLGFTGTQGQSAQVYGFMVQAGTPLRLIRAAIVPVWYGWIKTGAAWQFGTSADGGIIPVGITGIDKSSPAAFYTELPRPSHIARLAAPLYGTEISVDTAGRAEAPALLQTAAAQSGTAAAPQSITLQSAALQSAPEQTAGLERNQLILHFDSSKGFNPPAEQPLASKQPQLLFQCGNRQVSVYMAPQLSQLTLDGSLFPDSAFSVKQLNTEPGLIGITTRSLALHPLSPIPADAGLIVNWPQKHWRQPPYELFCWESFPSVLIFDFADYTIQDAYLKRLAFFAEKRGFAGRLISDAEMRAFHGFNAHDYRAETLAAFFQKAEQEAFPLNASERHLQTILLHNGIIRRTERGIEAGEGAILSISMQSATYLRSRLLTHEGLHGIYFTQESFRNMVAAVFEHTDPQSVRFLRRYFEVEPTLSYNTADSYLLQNEFMAYILQQGSSYVQEYYLTRLIHHRAIRKAEPELCEYMAATNAQAFVQAAEQMSSFLYTNWGLKAGRISLAELKRF